MVGQANLKPRYAGMSRFELCRRLRAQPETRHIIMFMQHNGGASSEQMYDLRKAD